MAATTEITGRNLHHNDTLATPELDRQGKYALLSVWDKAGIVDLATALTAGGYHIISTEGTRTVLEEHGIEATSIEELTGVVPSPNGSVKTLTAAISKGISFDRNDLESTLDARNSHAPNIDIVVINFYPVDRDYIDNGGPSNVIGAVNNSEHVIVVVDPADYERVARALAEGNVTPEMRRELADKASHEVAYYFSQHAARRRSELLPPEHSAIPIRKVQELSKGENPHQNPAGLYVIPGTHSPFADFAHYGSRETSLNNIGDIDAGLKAVRIHNQPAAAVIKHFTPCGIALGETVAEALARATTTDPKSVFGGVVVLNGHIDMAVVQVVQNLKDRKIILDIIAGSSIDDKALKALLKIRENAGIYSLGPIEAKHEPEIKAVDGGFLIQPSDDDSFEEGFVEWEVPTVAQPTSEQIVQAQLAWKFVSRVKSNAVVVVDPELPMTIGIGTGQTNRVGAAETAIELAGDRASGAIMASDSFFPFDDCVTLAASAGIGLVVQEGGSRRDNDSIAAANRLGIPMVFTHRRGFLH